MTNVSEPDNAAAMVMAALLSTGRIVHHFALVVFAITVVTLAMLKPPALGNWAVASLVIVATETYLAMRVSLDARLFRWLAQEKPVPLTALDAGLAAVGLRAATSDVRPLAGRLAGARRLMAYQVAATAAAALLLAAMLGHST